MLSIYMIMVCTKLETDCDGIPDFGSTKIVGFFDTKEKAERVVLDNHCNINEAFYKYAVIERVNEGMYPSSVIRSFYMFDEAINTYRKIVEPKCLMGYAGLII